MIRGLLLAGILIGCSIGLTSCGIVSHQIGRAANLLRGPVRVVMIVPQDASPWFAGAFRLG